MCQKECDKKDYVIYIFNQKGLLHRTTNSTTKSLTCANTYSPTKVNLHYNGAQTKPIYLILISQ